MNEESLRQYEFTFILSPELDERGIDAFEQGIERSIKSLGGELKNKSQLEKRNLAYPIKKFQSGYYLLINFLFSPEKLKDLSGSFKHNKDILRYIVVLTEEITPPVLVKKPKLKAEKIKEISEEISEEQLETAKATTKQKKKEERKEEKSSKLEEIDKKLEEILGI